MKDVDSLKNTYYVMRHGQSLGNVQEVIVSAPENGIAGYGLTPVGKQQATRSLTKYSILDQQTIIYSSDFLRARQTALIAEAILQPLDKVCFTKQLRERFFGDWELRSSDHYETVWAQDRDSILTNNVESVTDVLKRGLACLLEIEARFKDQNILLVSHGDTLQILLTFFKKLHPRCHRDVAHMRVAEIREAG